MGIVYTWDDVREGHIPTLNSFDLVAQQLRQTLASHEAIESAVICGSVLRRDHNVRSDIDCVVLYDADQEWSAIQIMQQIGKDAASLHVPVNFVPVDTHLAASSMHQLGRSFAQHIKSAVDAGGLVKGCLPDGLAVTQAVPDEVRSYIRAKAYNLEEGWSSFSIFSQERKAAYLKKMLESPLHIARKILHFNGLMNGDSKSEVRDKYNEWADSTIKNLFEELLELDVWYTNQLEEQQNCSDETKYRECWETLIAGIPMAISFVRQNALKLGEPYD